METMILKVEGMTCGHCKQSVEKALSGLAGVMKADVDLGKGTVSVTYDSAKVNESQMKEAVENQGYDVGA